MLKTTGLNARWFPLYKIKYKSILYHELFYVNYNNYYYSLLYLFPQYLKIFISSTI